MSATVERFITYKVPQIVESRSQNDGEGGMIYTTHVVMSDGKNLMISDVFRGSGYTLIDETLVFVCDASGHVDEWIEVAGARNARTDEIICELNKYGYREQAKDDYELKY